MGTVVVNNVKGTTVLAYVDELKSKGLILNQDFQWFFLQETKSLLVTFADSKYATFYQLKWSSR